MKHKCKYQQIYVTVTKTLAKHSSLKKFEVEQNRGQKHFQTSMGATLCHVFGVP